MNYTEDVTGSEGPFSQFGKYRLVNKIGEGGFGSVYKAYDPDLQVCRALKIPAFQTDNVREILKEAQLMARLSHPNMVAVHSLEQHDGRWAVVMEYLEGGSLEDKLNSIKTIPLGEALLYTECIASALGSAHSMNIVHHDIKPANILFDAKGVPKIADFGIARIVQSTNPEMSRVLGTVAYMSPEQLSGIADYRSDIWSLGVMLYQMITGRFCFEGRSQGEVVKNITMGRPAPLNLSTDGMPKAVERMIMRMLEKEPSDRYQSMDEVMEAVSEVRAGLSAPRQDTRRAPAYKVIALLVMAAAFASAWIAYSLFHEKTSRDQIVQPSIESAVGSSTRTARKAVQPAPSPGKVAVNKTESGRKTALNPKQTLHPEAGLPGAGKAVPAVNRSYVEIRTTPKGAGVYIDGRYKGESPLNTALPVGKHLLRLVHPGYLDMVKQIDVEEMMEYPLAFTLKSSGEPEKIKEE